MVIGAHCCVTQLLERRGERFDVTRSRLEQEVRYANITIIEGHDASQYGIGIASARIAEMILRDERAVVPIGSYNPTFGVTLSLPSVVGLTGAVSGCSQTPLAKRAALENGAQSLRIALQAVRR